jgi:hypothetical protein
MALELPKAPDGLNTESIDLWNDVVNEADSAGFELTEVELSLLREACRHLTLIGRLSDELDDSEMMVVGSTGQPTVNKLVGEIDRARRTLDQLLRSLRGFDYAAAGARGSVKRWGK